ncbi:chemotaxis protein CheW [Myxococcota bacterium]|nr:chemotaxis protein CheW [Myxococcota bacterium]
MVTDSKGLSRRMLTFWVGEVRLALDISQVLDLRRYDAIVFEREAGEENKGDKGSILFNDKKVFIQDLSDTLDVKPALAPKERRVIVAKGSEGPVAFLTDSLAAPTDIPVAAFFPMPSGLEKLESFYSAVIVQGDEVSLVLNYEGEAAPFVRPEPMVPKGQKATQSSRAKEKERIFLVSFTSYDQDSQAMDLRFALSFGAVPDVFNVSTLAPLPHSPHAILGLVPWRGQPLPVLNLSDAMGLPVKEGLRPSRYLVARFLGKEALCAIPVAQDAATLRVSGDLPTGDVDLPFDEDVILTTFKYDDGIFLIPDLDAIFGHFDCMK